MSNEPNEQEWREFAENEARQLNDKLPTFERDRGAVRKHAKEDLGYSDQELDSIYDHRAAVALHNSWLAERARRESQASENAEKVSKPRTVKDAGAYATKVLKLKW